MWKVTTFKGSLPSGFVLKEDEHFLYLFYGEKLIATFSSSGAEPSKVEEEALRFLQKFSEKKE
jgi:hypothetical protein